MMRDRNHSRDNGTLIDEIGMRAWLDLLAENSERWNRARFGALLALRVKSFRPWPYGQRPIETPITAVVQPAYRGDAMRLVEALRAGTPMGGTAAMFEFDYRRKP